MSTPWTGSIQRVKKQKCSIMINAEIFMRTSFIQTGETTEGPWLYFKEPSETRANLVILRNIKEIRLNYSTIYIWPRYKTGYIYDSKIFDLKNSNYSERWK